MNLRQAAQQALKEMDDHMYRADTHEFYEAKEALRVALAEPDYWQEEARRYAGNADYWRKRYEALAEPKQEPVAWISESENLLSLDKFYDDMKPLYTAPTPRKPLTDEEITDAVNGMGPDVGSYEHRLARAVIAAYEKKQGEQHE